MQLRTRLLALTAVATLTLASVGASFADPPRAEPGRATRMRAELPAWRDMSPMGARAAIANGGDASELGGLISGEAADAIQHYFAETKALGIPKRNGTLFVPGPVNVRANLQPSTDRVGETQSEIAICVLGDTVVIGWNDSQGFLAGNTISSAGYSTNGGATFTDMGNMPLALPTDQAFGDPGVDTDEKGNWYYNQIYTRPTSPAQQDIAVHRGTFGGGVLTWNTPVVASVGTSATGNLDKCLLATDRVTGNVYVAYTRFTATPQIEIVRSTTLGATWDPPIVLDNGTT